MTKKEIKKQREMLKKLEELFCQIYVIDSITETFGYKGKVNQTMIEYEYDGKLTITIQAHKS